MIFMLAGGRQGVMFPALTHSVYFTFYTSYSTRLPKKIDGGVEMMTRTMVMIEEFWTEAMVAGFDDILPLQSRWLI